MLLDPRPQSGAQRGTLPNTSKQSRQQSKENKHLRTHSNKRMDRKIKFPKHFQYRNKPNIKQRRKPRKFNKHNQRLKQKQHHDFKQQIKIRFEYKQHKHF